MAEEKIMTLHPDPSKSGKNITVERYDKIKAALLKVLHKKELNHTELMAAVNAELEGKFSGNIGWYAETLKLDLEARKIIERTNDKPQKYRLV